MISCFTHIFLTEGFVCCGNQNKEIKQCTETWKQIVHDTVVILSPETEVSRHEDIWGWYYEITATEACEILRNSVSWYSFSSFNQFLQYHNTSVTVTFLNNSQPLLISSMKQSWEHCKTSWKSFLRDNFDG